MDASGRPWQRLLRTVSLTAALLLLTPFVGAVGYSLDSIDHPGSFFVYDDLYEANDRVSFLAETIDVSFLFSADEDVQMRISAFENHTQQGARHAQGNVPDRDGTLQIPNVMYRWMRPDGEWSVQGDDLEAALQFHDDPDNVDRGYQAAAVSSQVLNLTAGVRYTISGSFDIPQDFFGQTPDLSHIVWDMDRDGTFDELLAWLSVTSWPTSAVDQNVSGAFLDTTVADTLIRLDLRPELEASFGSSGPMRADHRGVQLWPGQKTYTLPLQGSISVDVNEPVLVDVRITGDLASVTIQAFIDGEPAQDRFGNPWFWIPGSTASKMRIPEGQHEITFAIITDEPGTYDGEIVLERSNLIQESFAVQANVAPVQAGWASVGTIAVAPLFLLLLLRRRYRFAQVPDWKAGVCTRGGKAIAVLDRDQVIRFQDIETAAKEADASALEEQYGQAAAARWIRRRDGGLQTKPLPRFHDKKVPRHVQAQVTWSSCRTCPARDMCWDPQKRGSS